MAVIKDQRRCGNTTRQVDEWIQGLYDKGEVYMIDHAHKEERGRDTNFAQKYALHMLKKRLYSEHGIDEKSYTYDNSTKIFKFNNNGKH